MDQSTMKANIYLQIGGIFSLTFAVFQVSAIFWSQELLVYFGGPVQMQAENPLLYIFACLFVGVLVVLCGLYALSGAGKFRRLPLLRTVLIVVTTVFILRSFLIIPILKIMFTYPERNVFRFLVFSIIALVVGIIHLVGVIRLFKQGRPESVVNK
jgi:putative oxidoreductase